VGKPLPAQQFLGGALLWCAYYPLYSRAKKTGASTRLPLIGLLAAALLMWGGGVGFLLRRRLIAKSPILSPLEVSLLTAMVFGAGNVLKLLELRKNSATAPHVMLGQTFKVCASSLLVTSNCVLLGLHKSLPQHMGACRAALNASALSLLR